MKITVLKKWLSFRSRSKPITGIIYHATAGSSVIGSLETLVAKGFSYHYIIDRSGFITKCVPISKVAFHAGKSFGWGGSNCNDYTIGISLANWDNGKEPITKLQYEALVNLTNELLKDIPTITHVSTHYLVSPGRKSDPRALDWTKVEPFLVRKVIAYGNIKPF